MLKLQIAENTYLYQFIEAGYNIVTLVDDKKALIIDTAYPEPAKMIREDLEHHGIKPEILVFSHFHPDHVCGSSVFPECLRYGSEFYKENLAYCKARFPEHDIQEPTNMLVDGDELYFGGHTLRFSYTPGHSTDSITTIINDQIAHIGDLIMSTGSGKPILPLVCRDGSFDDHIKSLERIQRMDFSVVIPVHGTVLYGKSMINRAIDDRLYYLRKVRESHGQLPVEQCVAEDISSYENIQWHELNLRNQRNNL